MADNPEKFKQMLQEHEKEAKDTKTHEDKKEEEKPDDHAALGSQGSVRTKKSVKQKRPPVDKQVAYLEFKRDLGKPIENSILQNREEIKHKRVVTKDLTQKINLIKTKIDSLQTKIDKKEEERKLNNKAARNQMAMEAFEDDDEGNEEIIDEEELVMLKDMKDLKRDYRDSYSKLKGFKQELSSLQTNIDAQKEQLIF
jgi:hypothetical protein